MAALMQELIYGCMGLGGSWSDEPHATEHVDEAAAAVEAALGAGITLFDHADIYRRGKSEAVFGEVLASTPGLRDRIRLQTKCGIRLGEPGLPGSARPGRIARRPAMIMVFGAIHRTVRGGVPRLAPPGVGLGVKPTPVFLKSGDLMSLSIEGLGEQKQKGGVYTV